MKKISYNLHSMEHDSNSLYTKFLVTRALQQPCMKMFQELGLNVTITTHIDFSEAKQGTINYESSIIGIHYDQTRNN